MVLTDGLRTSSRYSAMALILPCGASASQYSTDSVRETNESFSACVARSVR